MLVRPFGEHVVVDLAILEARGGGSTNPSFSSLSLAARAFAPAERARNRGLKSLSNRSPPKALVSRYQLVEAPSVGESGRPTGYCTIPLALICLASSNNSSSVVGILVMPASANCFLFTSMTRKSLV